jgi:hypothetical protein
MSISLTQVLTGLSDAVAGLVDQAAPLLAAIRTTPGRHISGIIWQPDLVITADQLLPARDSTPWCWPAGSWSPHAPPGGTPPTTSQHCGWKPGPAPW